MESFKRNLIFETWAFRFYVYYFQQCTYWVSWRSWSMPDTCSTASSKVAVGNRSPFSEAPKFSGMSAFFYERPAARSLGSLEHFQPLTLWFQSHGARRLRAQPGLWGPQMPLHGVLGQTAPSYLFLRVVRELADSDRPGNSPGTEDRRDVEGPSPAGVSVFKELEMAPNGSTGCEEGACDFEEWLSLQAAVRGASLPACTPLAFLLGCWTQLVQS